MTLILNCIYHSVTKKTIEIEKFNIPAVNAFWFSLGYDRTIMMANIPTCQESRDKLLAVSQ